MSIQGFSRLDEISHPRQTEILRRKMELKESFWDKGIRMLCALELSVALVASDLQVPMELETDWKKSGEIRNRGASRVYFSTLNTKTEISSMAFNCFYLSLP